MTAPALAFWTDLLALPDFEVVYCQKESDLHCYRLTLSPTHRLGVCPQCGKVTDAIHQTRFGERIKDLSIGPDSVELTVRVLQFECVCGQHFTPPIPFLAEGAHATERFLERAAELIRTSDVANAAAFLGVAERTLAVEQLGITALTTFCTTLRNWFDEIANFFGVGRAMAASKD